MEFRERESRGLAWEDTTWVTKARELVVVNMEQGSAMFKEDLLGPRGLVAWDRATRQMTPAI